MSTLAMVVYDVVAAVLAGMVSIFFREIKARGANQVPKYGPVIFVAAPHHNQFLDPMMLIKTCGRRVGFLAAQKSLDRRWVGMFGRALLSIGVTRAMDIAVKVPGAKVRMPDPTNEPDQLELTGSDLKALVKSGKLSPGYHLLLSMPASQQAGQKVAGADESLEVAEILSSTRLRLRRAVTDSSVVSLLSGEGLGFRMAPKVDSGTMYQQVFDRLRAGRCIGIFPEGGSHDRSDLLPFKAGVAIMSLGAMAEDPSLDVKLVPVGLSYFHADKFRSRAVVEYGAPITVPRELVRQYANGGADKRHASKALLAVVQAAVANVTVTAPDYGTLMVVQAVRRLYRPLNRKLTLVQKLELTRRLVKGYLHYKDDPRVRDLEQKVQYYNQLLAYYGLQDHQVERTALSGMRAFALLAQRLVLLCIMGLVALPGMTLNAPIVVAASRVSKKKAKEALAASTVKLEGRDVLATWKVMVAAVLTPTVYLFYAVLTWILVTYVFELNAPWPWFIPLVVFMGLPYVSLIALSWGERAADIYRSLKPLSYSIMPTRWSTSHNLRQVRTQLARDLNDIINELGPTLFPDFRTFFLRDTEIPTTAQSAAGLKRVSSWVSTWLASQGYAGVPPSAGVGANMTSPVACQTSVLSPLARAAVDQLPPMNTCAPSTDADNNLGALDSARNESGMDLTRLFISADSLPSAGVGDITGRSPSASLTSMGAVAPEFKTAAAGPTGANSGTSSTSPRSATSGQTDSDDEGIVVIRASDVVQRAAAEAHRRIAPSSSSEEGGEVEKNGRANHVVSSDSAKHKSS